MQYSDTDPLTLAIQVVLLLLSVGTTLVFELAILYGIYFIVTIPMRRNERARLFLDLVELGLQNGQKTEAAIIDAARNNDRVTGARFQLLAAYLQKHMRLGEALDKVPRLLPTQLNAMLKAGERIGDVAKVLPACRRLLGDGVSHVRGALNYLLILVFVVSPAAIVIPLILNIVVIPKFKEVFAGMLEGGLPAFTIFVLGSSHIMLRLQIAVILITWFLLFAYIGGPRARGWFSVLLGPLPDWIQFLLPWRRKRLQRDFSAMLAVLLDARVPESEAVALAGDSTANSIIRRRAQRIRNALANGVKLPEAIRAIDDSGELHWRLSNALQRGRGFLNALNGWHEALDAKAFQQEQAAAQLTTTAMVLFNGFIVACVVLAMFLPLIALINAAALW
jgi:type II secretory pathway component PulF